VRWGSGGRRWRGGGNGGRRRRGGGGQRGHGVTAGSTQIEDRSGGET
jgi:hypothetical protein